MKNRFLRWRFEFCRNLWGKANKEWLEEERITWYVPYNSKIFEIGRKRSLRCVFLRITNVSRNQCFLYCEKSYGGSLRIVQCYITPHSWTSENCAPSDGASWVGVTNGGVIGAPRGVWKFKNWLHSNWSIRSVPCSTLSDQSEGRKMVTWTMFWSWRPTKDTAHSEYTHDMLFKIHNLWSYGSKSLTDINWTWRGRVVMHKERKRAFRSLFRCPSVRNHLICLSQGNVSHYYFQCIKLRDETRITLKRDNRCVLFRSLLKISGILLRKKYNLKLCSSSQTDSLIEFTLFRLTKYLYEANTCISINYAKIAKPHQPLLRRTNCNDKIGVKWFYCGFRRDP
jgi:hypothetical protein